MTEFWISQKKNFCEYCKVWTGGHLWQIRKHEEGRMHVEKKELYLKNSRQRLKDREREEEDVKKQLADIEKAALAAMGSEGAALVAASKAARPAEDSKSSVSEQKVAIEKTVKDAKRKLSDPGTGGSPSAGSSASPAAPVPAAEGSPWLVCTDPNTGHVYYYNKVTAVSSWERPADLDVDLSKPPPPPSSKPPPPPARKKPKIDAGPGGWEEVKPEDSMWGNQEEVIRAARRVADDSDEEQLNPLGDLKNEVMGRKGQWSSEDMEMREVEVVQKRSLGAGNATFSKVKKAGGIRKKREDD